MDKTVVDTKKLKITPDLGASSGLKIIFTVIQGKEEYFGQSFTFRDNKIIIGRDVESDLQILDEKISKQHCQVELLKNSDIEAIRIVDLKSTNGTYVNGNRIEQTALKSGDKIEVGETVLRFSYNDEVENRYHARLFDFATTDSLTGLYNKRYLQSQIINQLSISRRNERPFSLIMLDIDNFKKINDNYGHLAGDEILRRLSEIINLGLREQDFAGRFGGEEFLMVLPETDLEGGYLLAERLRKKVETTEFFYKKKRIIVTVSLGVSQFDNVKSHPGELIELADKALYRAKQMGRNRTEKN